MTRNEPVPRLSSDRTGTPRIEPQPSRSTSNGFIATATAGNSQEALCWSIGRQIASGFLACDDVLISLPLLRAKLAHPVLDRLAEAVAQPALRLPAEQVPRARDVRLAHLRVVDRQRLEDDLRA